MGSGTRASRVRDRSPRVGRGEAATRARSGSGGAAPPPTPAWPADSRDASRGGSVCAASLSSAAAAAATGHQRDVGPPARAGLRPPLRSEAGPRIKGGRPVAKRAARGLQPRRSRLPAPAAPPRRGSGGSGAEDRITRARVGVNVPHRHPNAGLQDPGRPTRSHWDRGAQGVLTRRPERRTVGPEAWKPVGGSPRIRTVDRDGTSAPRQVPRRPAQAGCRPCGGEVSLERRPT